MHSNINKQHGAAAIWFIFLIGAIMSLGALAIEGSRYIGKKARLGDASEAAAIAISANDGVTKGFIVDKEQRDGRSAIDVAKLWYHHYIPDEKGIEIEISRIDKKQEIKQDFITPYKLEYFRYDVSAKTTHDSWFRFSNWARFDDQVIVANKAAAGRIKGGHEPADVVFVADFSGSMKKCVKNGKFEERSCNKGEKNKLKHLQDAISEVTNILYGTNNKSTFGFIPFSKRIVIKRGNDYYCASPLLAPINSDFRTVRENNKFQYLLEQEKWKRDSWYRKNFNENQKKISEQYISWVRNGKWYNGGRAIDIAYGSAGGISYNNHIDYRRTAVNIRIDNLPIFPASFKYFASYKKNAKPNFGSFCTSWSYKNGKERVPLYYSIEREGFKSKEELNAKFNSVIENMRAGGGTDMYQGLLASPHQFYNASNKNRYIIVLSDGKENNSNFRKLVDNGLCENIREKLRYPYPGADYNIKMFVVGVGFNPRNYAYNKCFGKENIIPVDDMSKLKETILSLIADDIGHNFDRK